jgi:cysteine desulfurase/selenocysteine lyase
MPINTYALRRQFPVLNQQIDGKALIYLDSAATMQKPQAVIDAIAQFYSHDSGNANRGLHILAERATDVLEHGRKAVQTFVNAKHAHEIVFTKNATEAINLVAKSWGKTFLKKGDIVVLSIMEHHSNIIPWLQLKDEIGIEIRWIDIANNDPRLKMVLQYLEEEKGLYARLIDIAEDAQLKLEELDARLATGRVKLVSITAQSNVLGVRPHLQTIIQKAHDARALVLIDAAQFVAHHQTDVQALDADFLVFSGHKLYGPTGIGVLYAKESLLEVMPAFLGGGGMINTVTQESFTSADIPDRFEAGTQPLAQIAGLHAAIDWLHQYSWTDIEAHESALIQSVYKQLRVIPGLHIIGPQDPSSMSGCISFVIDGIHPHDLSDILSEYGVCLRAGHHCTQPLHTRLGLTATSRMSFGLYTMQEEIDAVAEGIRTVVSHFT